MVVNCKLISIHEVDQSWGGLLGQVDVNKKVGRSNREIANECFANTDAAPSFHLIN